MKLHIQTQIYENYGVHDWDGIGECPQYWKPKGGEDYFIKDFIGNEAIAASLVATLSPKIEQNTVGFTETVIGWNVVSDDYLTDYERSQMEYEGEIKYPSREIVAW